ncbi:hypothetical protein [Micromonospora aurantiaca (nom. illeg.)]|uniref:hypothetical protein n=1 Tax=Micromonospora aurantiaca (nom. illeg.) TaxID=47850 RepID=UPI0033DE2CEF
MEEEVAQRWWNGLWGRLSRRDVWLIRQTRWKVVARAGDTETGKKLLWTYDSRDEADAMVDRLLHADTAGQWRELQGGLPPCQADGGDMPRRRAR